MLSCLLSFLHSIILGHNAKLSGTKHEAVFVQQWRSHAQKAAQCLVPLSLALC
uniref:Uncharacterized protein n=1 Tax=Candidatus Kentrum sp. LFY TaxID=2126342 RepID=A0A450WVU8_9GAMM|nr:MAG: hypothetical protein BECKLFY1418C_GA0070996_108617 [Candidatus Kentron sp. LFY]